MPQALFQPKETNVKVLLVYANPNPKSFNHAILETMDHALKEAGHETKVKNLYAMDYKVILDGEDMAQIYGQKITPPDIKAEQDDILWADGLVIMYPVWWYGQPAILKGWIDRTFQNGFAFQWGKDGTKGLLKHKKAIVIQTAGEKYETDSIQEKLIKLPMTDGVLRYCGIENIIFKVFYQVPQATDEGRAAMLQEIADLGRNF